MTKIKKEPREGHRGRVREKFKKYGLAKLTDEEVLELLLSFGTPRRDCKQTARDMLKHFGSMRDVFEADSKDLAKIEGAGPTNIIAIKFVHAVAGKYLETRLIGKSYLYSSKEVLAYVRHHLENLSKEVFKVMYLDSGNGVIKIEDISQGSISAAYIHPREVVEKALLNQAAGLVFIHNHPSGNVKPSLNDQRLTRRLVHAAFLVEIKVLDHLIIGKKGEHFSFRDNGLISIYEQEVQESYQLPPKPGGGMLHEYLSVADADNERTISDIEVANSKTNKKIV